MREIGRAIERLLAGRDGSGLWQDFWTPAGMSDQWVSAYVATTLAGTGDQCAITAARETWQLLECDGFGRTGWGYARHVPPDADSTVWGLALAERLGIGEEERVSRADAYLATHHRTDGIATYSHAAPIRAFVQLPETVDFSAWTAAHPCVTAAAATLTGWNGRLVGALMRTQDADGSFPSYWWQDRAYATAMAARALALRGQETGAAQALARAATWAAETALATDAGQHPFCAALLVQILAAAARPDDHALARRLLEVQDQDGGWRGSAWLRVPRPDCASPERVARWERWLGFGPSGLSVTDPDAILDSTFQICSVDQFGHFPTATVVEALCRVTDRPTRTRAVGPRAAVRRRAKAEAGERKSADRDLIPDSTTTNAVMRRMFQAADSSGLLGRAVAYHLGTGGSGWRVRLALSSSAAYGVAVDEAVVLAAACELLHQASLVHDDILDASDSRRGAPTVRAEFGEKVAICLGDHLLAATFGVLADLAGQEAGHALLRCFASRLREVIHGQTEEFDQFLWRTMTPHRYRTLVAGKTGSIVALPLEGAALLAARPRRDVLRSRISGRHIGVAYQIVDDLTDLSGGDLAAGALNAMIIHHLDLADREERSAAWLCCSGRRRSLADLEHWERRIRAGGAVENSCRLAMDLLARARWIATSLPVAHVVATMGSELEKRLHAALQNAEDQKLRQARGA